MPHRIALLSTRTDDRAQQVGMDPCVFLLGSGSAVLFAGLALGSSHCEPPPEPTTNAEGTTTDSFPVYENVPEQDEPTDCFLCRTHRQGPCRAQWRNFEYCAKDHAGDELAGSQVCSKYVPAFQECWMRHLNLYLLIAMALNHERVETTERKYADPSERADDLETHIDWQEWTRLSEQDNFLEACEQVKNVFNQYERSMPVWRVYESLNEDPFLVNVTCQVPTRRKDGRSLRLVYALDQDNRTIGLADYREQYEIEKAESEGREPDLEYHRIVMSLIPGLTEAIKVKALYVSDATEDEDEGVATEDLDYADDPRSDRVDGEVLAESPWIAAPGLAKNLNESLT